MRTANLLVITVFTLSIINCSNENPTSPNVSPRANAEPDMSTVATQIQSHIEFLASDDLKGREPGTAGYDTAADYVANEFKKLAVQPAGNDGYFQTILFRRAVRTAVGQQFSVVTSDGSALGLEESVDYLIPGSIHRTSTDITTDIVFVGYGLVAPEAGRNDYAGLNVEGKYVAMLSSTPDGFQSEERAYYGARRSREASERGARGIISLATPRSESVYSFKRLSEEGRLDAAQMGWIKPDDGELFSVAPNIETAVIFSMEGAKKLFARAHTSWDDILQAAGKEGGMPPTFELPLSIKLQQNSVHDEIQSANVLGMIEGSDPLLKHEVVVLTAHLDHIGMANTDEEDVINNGALDNAAGVATLLEAARMLMNTESSRRSVLLLANTAEEKGLLGTQYFSKHQTINGKLIVANINLDMPVLTYDFQDLIVFGGDRSTLRGAIQTAASEMDLSIGKDPFPEQGVFTRSDHFRFVETGVPSVMLATGMANGGEAAWADHFARTYHRPADDVSNNIDYEAAAKFAELNFRILLTVANADDRPLWNKDDFFARQFDGPMLPD